MTDVITLTMVSDTPIKTATKPSISIANNKILTSKSEARRAITNKGIKINDVVIDDEKKILKLKDFKNKLIKLSYGKKKHYLVKII